ncbi:MFS transporter [Avibacterium paragallinarum]|uniref:MFS transporter n=2 Tax=Avibacterium paragallinarum TaxID=728 RepID=UPI001029FC79|nr:MFS transporter [Avibacterium paragallinarum]
MMTNKHNTLTWSMLISLYMTQYIGISFALTASIVVLRVSGFSLDKLALLNLIALPIAGKLFFALAVDHIRTFFQGMYRGWLIIAQSCMTILLVISSFFDIAQHFSIVLVLFLLYSVMTCIQDVAIDGLACKIFVESDRQKANAVQYASNLFGNIIGGGIILMFYNTLQWQGSLFVLSALTAISVVQLIFYYEPEAEKVAYKESRTKYPLIAQMTAFMKANKMWFFLLLILPSGFSSAYALINPMLVDAGWSIANIGIATKIYGAIIGVFSALLIIPLIKRFGRIKTLQYLLILQTLPLLCLLMLTQQKIEILTAYGVIGLYSLIQPALLASISTVIMDKAAPMQAKATFFSLQLSVIVIMGFIYATMAMSFAGQYGYFPVLLSSIALNLIAAIFTFNFSYGK